MTTPMIMPTDATDRARWEHTRQRRRMLDETWERDVSERLSERLTPGRVVNVGKPVTSLNLFHSTVGQLATQYDIAPGVTNPALEDPAVAAVWAVVEEDTHIWELGQSNAESVIGLRENLVRIHRTPEGVRLAMTYPDTVTIETAAGDPNKILIVREACVYSIDGEPEACWLVWDLSNPEAPVRTIRTASEDKDVSRLADPTWTGWVDYYEDGTPFLPYVRYRAKWSTQEWCAYEWSTLVEATLDVAILWTCWNKWVMDSSWAQRYVIDLALQGLTVTGSGSGATASIEADPASVMCFSTRGDKTGTAGQWQPPGDPKELADAIMVAQGSMLSNIGIHPADLELTSQPSSGTAIQLKRSSQRRLAKKYIPQFRSGDTELLGKIAATHNSIAVEGSPALPEKGWSLDYRLPEQSVDEAEAELAQDLRMIDAGLASLVDTYLRMHPGISREQALADLLRFREERALLSAATPIPNPQGE